jgi:sugar phosphate isomerase/epimerase
VNRRPDSTQEAVFRLGYNTNGLAHHRVLDALDLLAELGYEAVALTPDVGQLDPYELDQDQVRRVRERAGELGLELAVETGARYVLDARRKHFPTLLEDTARDRARRVDFLVRSLDLAHELGASVVSFWSGAAPGGGTGDEGGDEALWSRLVAGVEAVLDHADGSGVRLAFEPEPGMFIESPRGYAALAERLGPRGAELGLCLDVGHCLVTGDLPVGRIVRQFAARLVHVHLDDIAGGVHEHRMFGQGELDLPDTLSVLLEAGYTGIAAVELSRDSHRGPAAAAEAHARIRAALAGRRP